MKQETPSLFGSPDAYGGFVAATSPSPGELAKQAGIDRAASANAEILSVARRIARELAEQRGEITADDVQAELVRLGYGEHSLGNAAGALFRGSEWEWTGRRRKSRRVHAHANELKCWRLKGNL